MKAYCDTIPCSCRGEDFYYCSNAKEDMQAQCWICPYCHDNHSQDYECTAKKLTERIAALEAELAVYKRAKAENDERFMLERDEARAECQRYREALELIATPKRPDGTYNRGREACEKLAREALAGLGASANGFLLEQNLDLRTQRASINEKLVAMQAEIAHLRSENHALSVKLSRHEWEPNRLAEENAKLREALKKLECVSSEGNWVKKLVTEALASGTDAGGTVIEKLNSCESQEWEESGKKG